MELRVRYVVGARVFIARDVVARRTNGDGSLARAFTVFMCRGPGHLAGSLASQAAHSYCGAAGA